MLQKVFKSTFKHATKSHRQQINIISRLLLTAHRPTRPQPSYLVSSAPWSGNSAFAQVPVKAPGKPGPGFKKILEHNTKFSRATWQAHGHGSLSAFLGQRSGDR